MLRAGWGLSVWLGTATRSVAKQALTHSCSSAQAHSERGWGRVRSSISDVSNPENALACQLPGGADEQEEQTRGGRRRLEWAP